MVHYHVERKRGDNEAFGEYSEAVLSIVAELNEGLTLTAARGEFGKSSTIVRLMHEYMNLSSWEIGSFEGEGMAYNKLGDRSWNIVQCDSFSCVIKGGSW